jgi:hypothetical protein
MKPQDTANATLPKLTLTKETLRRLTAPELQLAAGGAPTNFCTLRGPGC